MRARWIVLNGLLVSLVVTCSSLARDVPFLSGRVNDTAGMLSAGARQRIEKTVEEFERKTTAQVVVLTIDGLEGEVLESYSVKVAQTWKLGQKGVDNGVLFLIVKNERKMRLEVGYGLESTLTDIACKRILDDIVKPKFRSGDFGSGIQAGVDAVIATAEGKQVVFPTHAAWRLFPPIPLGDRILGVILFSTLVGPFSVIALLADSWFMYVLLLPFYLIFTQMFLPFTPAAVLFLAWLIGFPVCKYFFPKTRMGKRLRRKRYITFGTASGRSSGSSSRSFSSGGGFSRGGFSGGGGSFGGGGASSSW